MGLAGVSDLGKVIYLINISVKLLSYLTTFQSGQIARPPPQLLVWGIHFCYYYIYARSLSAVGREQKRFNTLRY
jgi:hypothetical protein